MSEFKLGFLLGVLPGTLFQGAYIKIVFGLYSILKPTEVKGLLSREKN